MRPALTRADVQAMIALDKDMRAKLQEAGGDESALKAELSKETREELEAEASDDDADEDAAVQEAVVGEEDDEDKASKKSKSASASV